MYVGGMMEIRQDAGKVIPNLKHSTVFGTVTVGRIQPTQPAIYVLRVVNHFGDFSLGIGYDS